MSKNPIPPQQDPNVLWLSAKRHPKEIGWLMPDQRKKAWVDETSFRRFKNAATPPKGGAKGGADPSDCSKSLTCSTAWAESMADGLSAIPSLAALMEGVGGPTPAPFEFLR
jgi:hypothetical protein